MQMTIERLAMGARTSDAMIQTHALLWSGKTGYEASKITSITEGAISKSVACQKIMRAIETVQACLSTDESSTDTELFTYFTNDLGMPEVHARAWLKQRERYQTNPPPANRRRGPRNG